MFFFRLPLVHDIYARAVVFSLRPRTFNFLNDFHLPRVRCVPERERERKTVPRSRDRHSEFFDFVVGRD